MRLRRRNGAGHHYLSMEYVDIKTLTSLGVGSGGVLTIRSRSLGIRCLNSSKKLKTRLI